MPRVSTRMEPAGTARACALPTSVRVSPEAARRNCFMSFAVIQGKSPPQNASVSLFGVPPDTNFAQAANRLRVHPSGSMPSPFLAALRHRLQLADILRIRRQRLRLASLRIERRIAFVRDLAHALVADGTSIHERGPFVELDEAVHVLLPINHAQVLP